MKELARIRDFELMGTDTLRGMEIVEARYRECCELYSVGLLTLEEAKDKLRRG